MNKEDKEYDEEMATLDAELESARKALINAGLSEEEIEKLDRAIEEMCAGLIDIDVDADIDWEKLE